MEIRNIISWDFDQKYFARQGELIIKNDTKYRLNQFKKTIQRTFPEQGLISFASPELEFAAIEKFREYLKDPTVAFNRKEINVLTYNIGIPWVENDRPFYETHEFKSFLDLLSSHWRDSLVHPIWAFLMRHWKSIEFIPNEKGQLVSLLQSSLNKYDGNRIRFQAIKPFATTFFAESGEKELVKLLLKSTVQLNEIARFLFIEESYSGSEFLIRIYLMYIRNLDSSRLNTVSMEGVLEVGEKITAHSDKLLFYSILINEKPYQNFISKVAPLSTEEIGDPFLNRSRWQSNDLSTGKQEYVSRAQQKLQVIINKKFINYFFEVLVDDQRRKRYWLNRADYFTDIYFAGNHINKSELLQSVDMSNYVMSRYKTILQSGRNSAIIMFTKKHVFVDFSHGGALYIFRKENFKVNLNTMRYLDNLKVWELRKMAVRGSRYNESTQEEGRFIHQGDWERRLDIWMRRYFE